MVNEKCRREKINSFADAAKAKGGISEENTETSATNRGCCRAGFPGGFAAYARCPVIFSFSPCALYVKQDTITNGKHNVCRLISLVKT